MQESAAQLTIRTDDETQHDVMHGGVAMTVAATPRPRDPSNVLITFDVPASGAAHELELAREQPPTVSNGDGFAGFFSLRANVDFASGPTLQVS